MFCTWCVDVISQNIFHNMNERLYFQAAVCMEKRKKSKRFQAWEEFLHLGGRMQSVAWDSQRPPRVTN